MISGFFVNCFFLLRTYFILHCITLHRHCKPHCRISFSISCRRHFKRSNFRNTPYTYAKTCGHFLSETRLLLGTPHLSLQTSFIVSGDGTMTEHLLYCFRMGYPGRQCLLRSICETKRRDVHIHNGLLGDLLRIIFT